MYGFDDFDTQPQSDEVSSEYLPEIEEEPQYPQDWEDEEYSDAQRFDEMSCVDDYNRFEEEQVFQDREWED
jgi:hypothetical protein